MQILEFNFAKKLLWNISLKQLSHKTTNVTLSMVSCLEEFHIIELLGKDRLPRVKKTIRNVTCRKNGLQCDMSKSSYLNALVRLKSETWT